MSHLLLLNFILSLDFVETNLMVLQEVLLFLLDLSDPVFANLTLPIVVFDHLVQQLLHFTLLSGVRLEHRLYLSIEFTDLDSLPVDKRHES